MTEYVKDMRIEFKLFELYGLSKVAAAAADQNVAACDFVPLAEIVLPDIQARARYAQKLVTALIRRRFEVA